VLTWKGDVSLFDLLADTVPFELLNVFPKRQPIIPLPSPLAVLNAVKTGREGRDGGPVSLWGGRGAGGLTAEEVFDEDDGLDGLDEIGEGGDDALGDGEEGLYGVSSDDEEKEKKEQQDGGKGNGGGDDGRKTERNTGGDGELPSPPRMRRPRTPRGLPLPRSDGPGGSQSHRTLLNLFQIIRIPFKRGFISTICSFPFHLPFYTQTDN
jgi:hypothetical protein